jgi:hypothetical protein
VANLSLEFRVTVCTFLRSRSCSRPVAIRVEIVHTNHWITDVGFLALCQNSKSDREVTESRSAFNFVSSGAILVGMESIASCQSCDRVQFATQPGISADNFQCPLNIAMMIAMNIEPEMPSRSELNQLASVFGPRLREQLESEGGRVVPTEFRLLPNTHDELSKWARAYNMSISHCMLAVAQQFKPFMWPFVRAHYRDLLNDERGEQSAVSVESLGVKFEDATTVCRYLRGDSLFRGVRTSFNASLPPKILSDMKHAAPALHQKDANVLTSRLMDLAVPLISIKYGASFVDEARRFRTFYWY